MRLTISQSQYPDLAISAELLFIEILKKSFMSLHSEWSHCANDYALFQVQLFIRSA